MIVKSLLGLRMGRQGSSALSILIYHRVLPAPDPLFPDIPDISRFTRQLRWIRDWFEVLPLGESIERLYTSSLPARALSITFDDGYADNATVALPALLAAELNATFFVASGFLDGGCMWNDAIIDAVRTCPMTSLDLRSMGLREYSLTDTSERRAVIEAILNAIKHLDPVVRQEQVDWIVEHIGCRTARDLMMTSQQVKELRQAGMTIGGHTVNHPILAAIAPEEARREICECKEQLEAIIGERVSLFAYPNGQPRHDYTEVHVRQVREAGYDAAVTTAWGRSKVETDRYQLPRFTPWQASRLGFGLELVRNSFRRAAFLQEETV